MTIRLSMIWNKAPATGNRITRNSHALAALAERLESERQRLSADSQLKSETFRKAYGSNAT